MRTFQPRAFPGAQLVRRLEDEMQRTSRSTVRKVLPSPSDEKSLQDTEIILRHFPDLYGYRGSLPENKEVFYLNAWEFLMLWEVRRLPRPSGQPPEPSSVQRSKNQRPSTEGASAKRIAGTPKLSAGVSRATASRAGGKAATDRSSRETEAPGRSLPHVSCRHRKPGGHRQKSHQELWNT